MCGIVGIATRQSDACVDATRILRMREELVHRGPDGAGLWVERGVGLGHRRLAIVDPASGHQPMANAQGTIWLVFNGEIYNHAEIRARLEARGHAYRTRCDTESILHLYEEGGDEALEELEGMFAFALWDRPRRRLILARDRLGIKPLYIAESSSELLFASEIKALVAAGVRPRLRRSLVPEFLANRYVADTATLFDGVRRVPPGSISVWTAEAGLQTRRFWRVPADVGSRRVSLPDAADEIRHELSESVRRHLMSDVPLGVLLSGGIDSTVLAGLAAGMLPGRLKTFSVGFHEKEGNELDYARLAARAVGSDHYDVHVTAAEFFDALPKLVWHQDEPLAFTSNVPLYVVSKLAREHVKVVLTGEGADEVFLGYNRYRIAHWNERVGTQYWKLPLALRRVIRRGVGGLPSALRRYTGRSFLAHGPAIEERLLDNFAVFSRAELRDLIEGSDDAQPFAVAERCYRTAGGGLLDRMSAIDLQTYLHELLMKQDRMSMAASIESRVPFLDDRLITRALALPSDVKLRGWTTKAVLRKAVRDFVPREILTRSKMGFPVPLSRWFRTTHRSIVDEFVLGSRARARRLFRGATLERLSAEHQTGVANHAERLWLLVNLEIWHRIFCDGEQPADVMRPIGKPAGRMYAIGLDQGRRAVAGGHRWAAPQLSDSRRALTD